MEVVEEADVVVVGRDVVVACVVVVVALSSVVGVEPVVVEVPLPVAAPDVGTEAITPPEDARVVKSPAWSPEPRVANTTTAATSAMTTAPPSQAVSRRIRLRRSRLA